MHSDLAHLLRYAKQYPDDDIARLVLADWLEENGDIDGRARAQFIRLQLRLRRERMMAARRELEAEIAALRLQHLHYWLGGFVEVPGVFGAAFECGLLRLRIRPAIVPEGLARLPRLPDWAWVDGLICDTRWPLGDVTVALMTSPTLAGLRYLNFAEGDPSPAAFIRLANNPAVADLHILDMTRCQLDRYSTLALIESPNLARLHLLLLENAHVETSDRQALRKRFGDRVQF